MMMILWKRMITNHFPSSTAMPSLASSFTVKPHITFSNFYAQTTPPFTTPPQRGVVTKFLLNKCGLSEEEITKTYRHDKGLLRIKSIENMEKVLELLNGCGLTNPAQIRRVVLSSPRLFFAKRTTIQPKLTLLRTFMKEEDLCKLLITEAHIFRTREDKLKSSISRLQSLGVEGPALSKLVTIQPRLLTASVEKVLEAFKRAKDWGFEKGSKMFPYALRLILGAGKEAIDRRLRCLSSSGFSEKQISKLLLWSVGSTEKKLERNLEFLFKTVGLPLDDVVKVPYLLGYSLEKRMIPRYRVMEALKSMRLSKTEMTFLQIVKLPERRFLEKYINSNAEYTSVLSDIYHGAKAG